MKKINFNPYKKREKYEISTKDFENLKDLAFSNDIILPSKRMLHEKKIKGARFLNKLKKKFTMFTNEVMGNGNNDKGMSNENKEDNENNVNTDHNEHEQRSSINNLSSTLYDKDSTLKNNPAVFFQKLRKPSIKQNTDEKVWIDNVAYYRTNIKEISEKVLEKCNFKAQKSKYSNDALKFGNGKMMITNGLSVSEFSRIYNLNP